MAVTSNIFLKNNILGKLARSAGRKRARKVLRDILPFIDNSKKVVDVGAGNAFISELLVEDGLSVHPIDVADLSLSESVDTVLYDGRNIPYKDNFFGTALVISVLHHTKEPEKIIKEAKRTSEKIIIMEDIYKNTAHKYATWIFDSMLNQQFKNHPHSNKTDEAWKDIFNKAGLDLVFEKEKWWYLMRHKIYVLEK